MECIRCHEHKDESDFPWRIKSKQVRRRHCKKCQASYHNDHYVKNKQVYISKAKKRTLEIKEIIDNLKRNPCTDCGRTEHPCAMDFDHLHGKTDNVSVLLLQKKASLNTILREIEKCELVCAVCHRKRTYFRQVETDPSTAPSAIG